MDKNAPVGQAVAFWYSQSNSSIHVHFKQVHLIYLFSFMPNKKRKQMKTRHVFAPRGDRSL